MRRTTLRLTLECNNRCLFCAQQGLAPAADARPLADRVRAVRATDVDELTFTGGEPTLDPALPEAIAIARSAGFRRVGIQTNGRLLANGAFTAQLAKAGLTDVHVSLHGADAAVHDYHVGVEGAFAQLLAGIGSAGANGLAIGATTVLTRSNYRVLAGLPRLLKATGVAGWVLAVPRVAGGLAARFDKVSPRLGLALPFALHALEAARQLRLPAWIQGAPACALGPLASRALRDAPRAYAKACEGCPSRLHCPGLDAAYLARFGGDELGARETAPPDAPSEISRLFVGAGELAIAAAHTAAPPGPLPIVPLGRS